MPQQVYRRVANPYMPNGTPNLTNTPSPYYAPGELGYAFSDQNTGGEYLRVQLDSGATAATAVGVVAAGQLAFWKNKGQAIVTNDKNQCDVGPSGAVNRVAGIFQLAVTAGGGVNGADGQPLMYMCDLVLRKDSFNVQATGTLVAGAVALADTTANTARAIAPAAVNTAPVTQILGTWLSTTITSNVAPCNVSIGFSE